MSNMTANYIQLVITHYDEGECSSQIDAFLKCIKKGHLNSI